ncbi:MAG: ribosome small subunit-dependent GTPase A [Clostridia bacterium]|nr:ribosome small subunit-dependent GTPase A [Clostridia bacterium]
MKGIGGFYYVYGEDGSLYECRAKGKFRNIRVRPAPGDDVEFTPPTDTLGGSIDFICDRKNELQRPFVVNIDQLAIVISVMDPAPDFTLVDKMMIYGQDLGVPVVLVLNKIDLRSDFSSIADDYRKSGVSIVAVSSVTGEGMQELKEHLRGRITCFSGQSAVGKSTLLNAIGIDLNVETGELSAKTRRGRHTTRHTELFRIEELDAYIMDTPGFSSLESLEIEPEDLGEFYPEFRQYIGRCRFDRCVHINEPDCEVKNNVLTGEIPEGRYERYKYIYKELLERRNNRYV